MARRSDILPSGQHVGPSVSLGYLRIYMQRANARTMLVHALTGENCRILRQVEYRGVEFEAFENEVLHPGTAISRSAPVPNGTGRAFGSSLLKAAAAYHMLRKDLLKKGLMNFRAY
jgi:hypothetical protein